MGPSAAWFYEGQFRLHRNNNNNMVRLTARTNLEMGEWQGQMYRKARLIVWEGETNRQDSVSSDPFYRKRPMPLLEINNIPQQAAINKSGTDALQS